MKRTIDAPRLQRSKYHASHLSRLAHKKQAVMECHGFMAPPLVVVGLYRRTILIIVAMHVCFVQLSDITEYPAPGKLRLPFGPGQEDLGKLEGTEPWDISTKRTRSGDAI